MRTAFLLAPEGVELIEPTTPTPWHVLARTGKTPRPVSTVPGTVQAFDHRDRVGTFPPHLAVFDDAILREAGALA